MRWRVSRDPSFRVVGKPLASGEMAAIRRKWEGG